MRWIIISAIVVIAVAATPKQAELPSPLEVLVARSELVISAKIKGKPLAFVTDAGTLHYIFLSEQVKVLHGSHDGLTSMRAALERPEYEGEQLAHFVDGAECIVFLNKPNKNVPKVWRVSDRWFGVQPMNRQMASRIQGISRRLR